MNKTPAAAAVVCSLCNDSGVRTIIWPVGSNPRNIPCHDRPSCEKTFQARLQQEYDALSVLCFDKQGTRQREALRRVLTSTGITGDVVPGAPDAHHPKTRYELRPFVPQNTVKKTLKRRHYPLRGLTNQPELKTPLSDLPFPVYCSYPDCGDGPFENAGEVDEHISDMHLPEAVWTFAAEHMKP